MELNEDAFVDEDSFDDILSGDDSDSDYEDMRLIADDQEMQIVDHVLRNRMVVMNIPRVQFSSPPSSPCFDDLYPEESLQETVNGFMNAAADLQEGGRDTTLKNIFQEALNNMDLFLDCYGLNK